MSDLLTTLKSLSPADGTLWNDDGLPNLEAVSNLFGSKVSRATVNKVALGLTRDTVETFVPIMSSDTSIEDTSVIEIDTTDYKTKAEALELEVAEKRKVAELAAEEALAAQKALSDAQSKIVEPDVNVTLEQTMIAHQAYLKEQESYRQSKIKAFEDAGLTLDDLYVVFPQLRGSIKK